MTVKIFRECERLATTGRVSTLLSGRWMSYPRYLTFGIADIFNRVPPPPHQPTNGSSLANRYNIYLLFKTLLVGPW